MAFNGSEQEGVKKKEKETKRHFGFVRRNMGPPAAECGLDVLQAVNWQKQGHRLSPLPRLQWYSFTVGCPELPKDRQEKNSVEEQLVQQPGGFQSHACSFNAG